jgi:hypothetical protein
MAFSLHRRLGLALSVFVTTAVAACGFDWDLLDPSLGPPGDGSTASSTGAGGAGGSSSTAVSSSSSSGDGGAASVSSSSGAGGGSTTSTVNYVAVVADCIDPMDPNPTECEVDTGFGIMSIDEIVSGTGARNEVYIRFNLDGALSGKSVVSVKLRLVVSNKASAGSDQTGEVWEVAPFMKTDLYLMAPSKVGVSALASDMGSVSQGEQVDWDLPITLVAPNSSVFLGVFPVSTDGVEYWNATGDVPPELIIEYQ